MDFVHPVRAVIPGVQGRLLSVLVETTAELSLRTLARLGGVSAAQASRVLPDLVVLGLVERRDVPPSAMFRLARSNVAAEAVIALARSWETVLERLGAAAGRMDPAPVSVLVFGSFARREADRHSDLDVVMVRVNPVDEDDERWLDSLERWRTEARAISGNPVEVLEFDRSSVAAKLSVKSREKGSLWHDIVRDAVVVHGIGLAELRDSVRA